MVILIFEFSGRDCFGSIGCRLVDRLGQVGWCELRVPAAGSDQTQRDRPHPCRRGHKTQPPEYSPLQRPRRTDTNWHLRHSRLSTDPPLPNPPVTSTSR